MRMERGGSHIFRGMRSEVTASLYYLNRGYYVYTAIGGCGPFDLLVVKDDVLSRIEVRTGNRGKQYTDPYIAFGFKSKDRAHPPYDYIAVVYDGRVLPLPWVSLAVGHVPLELFDAKAELP